MFTANTMSSAVEALGMALPGEVFFPFKLLCSSYDITQDVEFFLALPCDTAQLHVLSCSYHETRYLRFILESETGTTAMLSLCTKPPIYIYSQLI